MSDQPLREVRKNAMVLRSGESLNVVTDAPVKDLMSESVQHVQPGDRVIYWPGVRSGEGRYGRALSTVWPKAGNNFGTDVVRIEKDGGGTDYIATTHLVVVEPDLSGD